MNPINNNLNQNQPALNPIIKTTAITSAVIGTITALASAILWASNAGVISIGITIASLPPILPIAFCAIGISVALISIIFLCIKKIKSTPPSAPSVNYPLLEKAKGAYDLQVFTARPLDDSIFDGGNRVEIPNPDGEPLILPRTLYHLLFIYFSVDSNIDVNQFPILETAHNLNSKESLDPTTWFAGELQDANNQVNNRTALEISKQNLNAKILAFIRDRGLIKPSWKDTENIVNELIPALETIYREKNDVLADRTKTYLWNSFFTFCFDPRSSNSRTAFKSLVTQALAVEWTAPANSEIFYRTSRLSEDNIKSPNNSPYSLSFGTSLFSGIIFEGARSGTCPYTYYSQSLISSRGTGDYGKQLYALEVSASKANKYFFAPPLKDLELLPLSAQGEFSHPRLKFF
jgi:hypothetical protein